MRTASAHAVVPIPHFPESASPIEGRGNDTKWNALRDEAKRTCCETQQPLCFRCSFRLAKLTLWNRTTGEVCEGMLMLRMKWRWNLGHKKGYKRQKSNTAESEPANCEMWNAPNSGRSDSVRNLNCSAADVERERSRDYWKTQKRGLSLNHFAGRLGFCWMHLADSDSDSGLEADWHPGSLSGDRPLFTRMCAKQDVGVSAARVEWSVKWSGV